MAAIDKSARLTRRQLAVLLSICLAVWIIMVDATAVNVALAPIGAALHPTNADLQWVLDAFNVTVAGLVLIGSGLGDRFGRRKMFCLGISIFTLASAGAAVSGTTDTLISWRVAMGIGVALVLPASLSIIAETFHGNARKTAVAAWAAIGGLGLAFGPVIGGLLLSRFSWGSAFLINVPFAVLACIGVGLTVAESRKPNAGRIDFIGGLLSLVGLGALVFGLIEAPASGWTDPVILTALTVGVLGLVAFALWELRTPEPLFDVRIFKHRSVAIGIAAVSLMYWVIFAVSYLLPQAFQYGDGMTPAMVGLAMFPIGFTYGMFAQTSPAIMRRFGARIPIGAGFLIVGAMLIVLALNLVSSYWVLLPCILIYCAGWSQSITPATVISLDAVAPEDAGHASAANQVSRQVGGAIGVAVVGCIVSSMYSHGLSATPGLTPQQVETAQRSLPEAADVAAQIGGTQGADLLHAAVRSFETAASTALIVTGVLALILGVAALCVLRESKPSAAPVMAEPVRELQSMH